MRTPWPPRLSPLWKWAIPLGCRSLRRSQRTHGEAGGGGAMRLWGARLVGVEGSAGALEVARAKAGTMADMVSQYWLAQELPTSLPSSAFSHALALHPLGAQDDRNEVLAECARLLAANGHAVIVMPLRGSFQELLDLLLEKALNYHENTIHK